MTDKEVMKPASLARVDAIINSHGLKLSPPEKQVHFDRNEVVEMLSAAIAQPEQPDTTRLDWLAMYGSFGAESSSGLPGGNGQKRLAATRKNVDAAMAQTESTK